MLTKKIRKEKEVSPKAKVVTDIIELMILALAPLKLALGEKKFEKRVKKAAKLLVHGMKPPVPKKASVKKVVTKKATPKSVIPVAAKKAVAVPAKTKK